jgi:GAF domain-containing protein
MAAFESRANLKLEELQVLAEMTEIAVSARTAIELAESTLNLLSRIFGASSGVLYGTDPYLAAPFAFHVGLSEDDVTAINDWYSRHGYNEKGPTHAETCAVTVELAGNRPLQLCPLAPDQTVTGFLGLTMAEAELPPEPLMSQLLRLLSRSLSNLLARQALEAQNHRLNTYLNVSSMIAQPLALKDVLEAVLFLSMDAVSAEAASVLILDHEKRNLRFYALEGAGKPVLAGVTFPADRGIAGAVLQSLQSEIINEVQSDLRFYGKIDEATEFVTRNMVVVPLVAGEEKIGVLEVLNKGQRGGFTEEDRQLLQFIAQEIAFAIRDAIIFEWVVNSYCKQRQGLNTCKGCKRPLGSWTPCVKYREEAGLLG